MCLLSAFFICNARLTTNQRGRVRLFAFLFVNPVTQHICGDGCWGKKRMNAIYDDGLSCVVDLDMYTSAWYVCSINATTC